MPSRLVVTFLAIVLDRLIGEFPNALHPVAWFGKLVQGLERRAPRGEPRSELAYGAFVASAGVVTATVAANVVERVAGKHWWLSIAVQALAFKTMFAWRALVVAGERVQADLEQGDRDAAVTDLRALVSRDTSHLDESHMAAAAVESLAENASDSLVAPLFYYTLFGLPGAFIYRAANTLDSMIGYHGRYEYLGKVPARLDDALNWIPARLTALALVGATRITRGDARGAWQALVRDHALTESPNAGYPMSAMAGALDVRLEKVGHYSLNTLGRDPAPRDISSSARIVNVAIGMAVAAGALTLVVRRRS